MSQSCSGVAEPLLFIISSVQRLLGKIVALLERMALHRRKRQTVSQGVWRQQSSQPAGITDRPGEPITVCLYAISADQPGNGELIVPEEEEEVKRGRLASQSLLLRFV